MNFEGHSLTTEELAYRNMYRVKQIISERNIFSQLNKKPNPFIVKMHSAFTSKNYLYMVLDLCPGGDLFNLIQRHKNFTAKQAKFLIAEVILAVEHLHKNNILYRDLKPENILIDEWGHLKLTDFGLSKENFGPDDETKTICGSPEYYCPEILQDDPYGFTLDFYSLGVLLYELITGLPPYFSEDQEQMQKDIIEKEPKLNHLSGDCKDLITKLLKKNPKERLGYKEGIGAIKKHRYFSTIDWNIVMKRGYRYEKQYLKIDLTVSNFESSFGKPDINIEEEIQQEAKRKSTIRKARSQSVQQNQEDESPQTKDSKESYITDLKRKYIPKLKKQITIEEKNLIQKSNTFKLSLKEQLGTLDPDTQLQAILENSEVQEIIKDENFEGFSYRKNTSF